MAPPDRLVLVDGNALRCCDTVCRLVRREMEGVYPLAVPLVVDVGVGESWGEAH